MSPVYLNCLALYVKNHNNIVNEEKCQIFYWELTKYDLHSKRCTLHHHKMYHTPPRANV